MVQIGSQIPNSWVAVHQCRIMIRAELCTVVAVKKSHGFTSHMVLLDSVWAAKLGKGQFREDVANGSVHFWILNTHLQFSLVVSVIILNKIY